MDDTIIMKRKLGVLLLAVPLAGWLMMGGMISGHAQSNNPPGTVKTGKSSELVIVVDLVSLKLKLEKEMGGKWLLTNKRSGFRNRPCLTGIFSNWHHVSSPLLIVPSFKSDKIGIIPQDYEGSMAMDVIAKDQRLTVCAGMSYDRDVAIQAVSIVGIPWSEEAEQRRLRNVAAEWLDFRLVVAEPSIEGGNSIKPLKNGPSQSQINEFRRTFATKGRNAGQQQGDSYLWFPLMDYCQEWPTMSQASNSWTPKERPYVLLSNKTEETLLCGSSRLRLWHLKSATAGVDSAGRPAVVLELDEASAQHLTQCLRNNPGCGLAILFDGAVVQIIKADTLNSGRILFTGKNIDKTIAARIARSMSECMTPQSKPLSQ